MANLFGAEVDDDKLDEMSKYIDKVKSQEDRAREAMNLINDDDKNRNAQEFVENYVKPYIGGVIPYIGGGGLFTACHIYNATGDTLYFVRYIDIHGFIGPTPYPTEIGNGQWAPFVHVQPATDLAKTVAVALNLWGMLGNALADGFHRGSHGAVVYRGKNRDGRERDYIIVWSTPENMFHTNKCYSGVGSVGSYDQSTAGDIKSLIKNNGDRTHKTDKDGCIIEVSIAKGDSPHCLAILKTPYTDSN